jgi:hypothetical protein
LETVIKILRHFGDADKKIWITETGWATDKHELKKTLDQQAEWAPWTWAVLLSYPQVERVFFYQLRDRMDDEHFGWFDKEFNPRPVVARWKELLKAPSTQAQKTK